MNAGRPGRYAVCAACAACAKRGFCLVIDIRKQYLVHHRKRKPDPHRKTTDRIRKILLSITEEEKKAGSVAESLLAVVGELEGTDDTHSFVTLLECVMAAADDYAVVGDDEVTGQKVRIC